MRYTILFFIVLIGIGCKKKNEQPITVKYVFNTNSTTKMVFNIAGFGNDTSIGNASQTMVWNYISNGVVLSNSARLLADTVSKDFCQVLIFVNGNLFATGNSGKTSSLDVTYKW